MSQVFSPMISPTTEMHKMKTNDTAKKIKELKNTLLKLFKKTKSAHKPIKSRFISAYLLELLSRFERPTSSLPRMRSTY